ncbi:MAG: riboflavin synthase [Selenomonadaceae bacterium]|nr:riboflavin synthase [Selenomonadaceae bacterium]
MFTGIVEEVGSLKRLAGGQIAVACGKVLSDAHVGDSIAVNGICLTVTSFGGGQFTADVMPETIRRTSLSELRHGSAVNLERALTPASRMGGHIVSGHIDGTGTIAGWKEEGNAILLTVAAEEGILRYIVEKGSVALDGISLTVTAAGAADFTVSLIPHTRESTNLREKHIGSLLNIETDIIGKYVERMLKGKDETQGQSGVTREMLQAYGF